jgi:hypothetical protein
MPHDCYLMAKNLRPPEQECRQAQTPLLQLADWKPGAQKRGQEMD